MVDILTHVIFDGAPLIIPIMVLFSGASIYLIALAIDKMLNTIEDIKIQRSKQQIDIIKKITKPKRKPTDRQIEKMVKAVTTKPIRKKVIKKVNK